MHYSLPHLNKNRGLLVAVGVLCLIGLWIISSGSRLKSLPRSSEITKTLVVPRVLKEDTSWALSFVKGYKVINYVADIPNAPHHIPSNKGHEAMAYLTYIIEHYDKLSDVTVFMHAHQIAWHNNDRQGSDAVRMLQDLRPEYILHRGFHNLRCPVMPGCGDMDYNGTQTDGQKRSFISAWKEMFRHVPVPDQVGTPCCAQFAVSRWTIRNHPRQYYEKLQHWLLQTEQPDELSGRVFEYLWHIMFGMDAVDCPDEKGCYCNLYGRCNLEDPSEEDI